jgi:hypothetical protein
MKFLILLFNFYILALSILPCNDVDVCNENSDTKISMLTTNNKDDHKQTENCTPFCICSCCAVPIIHQATNTNEIVKQTYLSVQYPSLKIFYPSYSSVAIWQPPKFC